jgi:hypothetical protein
MPIPSSALEDDPFLKVLLLGPPKTGKAEQIDEPVLTPTGWRAIGALHNGDEVIGSNGKPTIVTGVFPQGRKRLVRFTSDDSASVLCSEDHLWFTTTKQELTRGRYYRPRIADQRTRPRIPTGRVGTGSVKTAREVMLSISWQHFLPRLSAPATFRGGGPLTMDPYLLGLLLGDGSLTEDAVIFTKGDEELLQTIALLAQAAGDQTARGQAADKCPYIRIHCGVTRNALEELGLIGTFSHTKFIPRPFLFASPADRLAILQGLCDTDGYAVIRDVRDEQRVTQAEYSTTSPQLRDDVLFIARSLGARARAIEIQPTYTYKDERLDGRPAWRISISFDDDTCPFRLKRKAKSWLVDRERVWRARVESVEPAGVDECVCITVDAPDRLFVTKDFLVTHNSTTAICTAPAPVRVLLCEADTALRPARQRGGKFDFERCRGDVTTGGKPYEQMTQFIVQAKEAAKAGEIKTLVIDPLSYFAERLLEQSFSLNKTSNANDDGRRAYPHYGKRLLHCIDLAMTIPCHLIVVSHFVETNSGDLGGVAKTGEGVVPLVPGSVRTLVAARFNDVVWFDLDRHDKTKRMFYTAPQGAWGPGCRSLTSMTSLPADFKGLIKAFAEDSAGAKVPSPKPQSLVKLVRPTPKPQPMSRKP